MFRNWDVFDRLFDDFGWPTASRWANGEGTVYSPPVDIHHTGEEILVRAELPGVKPENVELTIHGDALTIKGSKKTDEEEGAPAEGKYRYVERRYGEFMRTFALPTLVDESKAKANFKDGVLEIRMPVAEEAKPRRIAIANTK
jgi:HSP20 family protein